MTAEVHKMTDENGETLYDVWVNGRSVSSTYAKWQLDHLLECLDLPVVWVDV